MWNIPTDVTEEILVQFPAEFLLRLRGVCKAWRLIIEGPSFIRAHSQYHAYNHTLLLSAGNKTEPPLYSFSLEPIDNGPQFSLDSLYFTNGTQIIDATLCKQLIRCEVPLWWDRDLLKAASCNGLILLSCRCIWNPLTDEKWRNNIPPYNCGSGIYSRSCIWNPLTGKWRDIPPYDCGSGIYGFGFGYDTGADDFKVVRIENDVSSRGRKLSNLTLMYSLKLNSWREIAACPCRVSCRTPAASVDGKLYWQSEDESEIVALDLRTETYCFIPLPQEVVGIHLNALDGCLILIDSYFWSTHFAGWVMKNEGLNKSWIQLFLFNRNDLGHDLSGKSLRVVAYLKSKRQVILQHELGFVCIDLNDNSFKKFSINGFPHIESCKICPGSLVRLNTNDEGARKTSTKKRKRKNTKRRV